MSWLEKNNGIQSDRGSRARMDATEQYFPTKQPAKHANEDSALPKPIETMAMVFFIAVIAMVGICIISGLAWLAAQIITAI